MRRQIFLGFLLTAVSLTASEQVSSKYPIELYGFIRMDAQFDNTEIAKGDWLLYVRPGNSKYADQSIFSMTARHSRLGMKIGGPHMGKDGTVKGLIEVDFAGGFPNSSTAARQPQLRMRHAWVEINTPGWELRLGQDWALIAGPFPNTTSFVVGAGKGNLWMRYPQIKYTVKRKALKLALSANRPMAGNIKYDSYAEGDFDPVGDGERSGMPWFMGRAWWTLGSKTLSLSGHYGKEQIADLSGSDHDVSSFSMNADVIVPTGPVTWTARAFTGENLNSFFGGVFKGYTMESTKVTNVASKGGWGQAVYTLNPQWALTLGGGMDDPDDADLAGDARTKNTWLFGNIELNFSKSLLFILETEYLKTDYKVSDSGDNIRVQFVTYLKF